PPPEVYPIITAARILVKIGCARRIGIRWCERCVVQRQPPGPQRLGDMKKTGAGAASAVMRRELFRLLADQTATRHNSPSSTRPTTAHGAVVPGNASQ